MEPELEGDRPVHRLVDAWVSTSAQKLAAVRETTVHPWPLVVGLMLAYRVKRPIPALVLVLPAVDSFRVAQVPRTGGDHAQVHASVSRTDLVRWFEAIEQRIPDVVGARLGADLVPARLGEAPRAVVYATLLRRREDKWP